MNFRRTFLAAASFLLLFPAMTPARAAAPDHATTALATVANDVVALSLRYPDVARDLNDGRSGRSDDSLLAIVGGVAVGMRAPGAARADRVAVEAFLGRAFLLANRIADGKKRLEAALAEAERLGWSDARMNGMLRDLAWVAEQQGDAAAAARYAARAATCPAPCADDAVAALYDKAKAARDTVFAAFGKSAGYYRIADVNDADAVTFAEETYGPTAPEARAAWLGRAVGAREHRPWKALEYYQHIVEIDRAGTTPIEDQIDVRHAIAELLLDAGEYERLVPYAEALARDAAAAATEKPDVLYLPGDAADASRLKARALWHLRDPRARDAYKAAVDAMFHYQDADLGRLLLQDLLDARYDDEALRVADAFIRAFPGDEDALLAKGRVLARRGDPAGAAETLAAIKAPSEIARLQRAFYLDRAGKPDEAKAVRAGVTLSDPQHLAGWSAWSPLSALIEPRDFGAYEGAAAVARIYLDMAERMIKSGTYTDAQRLWQIAFTLARGGETSDSFRLMSEAASIAARLSFAEANDTDGGSLQLLRRDKFRYLLFVDIAWAAATGATPDSMSVSSRY